MSEQTALATQEPPPERRGRWEEGTRGHRSYRSDPKTGDRYPVLTFACRLCADCQMHTRADHALMLKAQPGRYVREVAPGFRPRRGNPERRAEPKPAGEQLEAETRLAV